MRKERHPCQISPDAHRLLRVLAMHTGAEIGELASVAIQDYCERRLSSLGAIGDALRTVARYRQLARKPSRTNRRH
jgi:hypothetical protein